MKRDSTELAECPLSGTPEWYAARKTGIGASEAAAACGMSEWATALDIYLRKRQLVDEQADNQRMRMGRRLEPIIIDEYEDRSGLSVVRPCGLMRHPEHPHIFATPDGDIPQVDKGLECKATNFRQAARLGDEGTDSILDEWLLQSQQGMAVTGRKIWDVAVLVDGFDLKVFTVERNESLIACIIAAETELWQRIQNGDPPEPDWTHARTPELIRELHGVSEGLLVALSVDAARDWELQARISERLKKWERLRDGLKARALHAMGEAEVAVLPDGLRRLKRFTVERAEHIVKASRFVSIREGKCDKQLLKAIEQQRLLTHTEG